MTRDLGASAPFGGQAALRTTAAAWNASGCSRTARRREVFGSGPAEAGPYVRRRSHGQLVRRSSRARVGTWNSQASPH